MKKLALIGIFIATAGAAAQTDDTFGAPLWAPGMRNLVIKRYEGAKACDDAYWPPGDPKCAQIGEAIGLLMMREAKDSDKSAALPAGKVKP